SEEESGEDTGPQDAQEYGNYQPGSLCGYCSFCNRCTECESCHCDEENMGEHCDQCQGPGGHAGNAGTLTQPLDCDAGVPPPAFQPLSTSHIYFSE
ncbi:HRC isoform 3, partial [Pongo abelii]